MNQEIRQPKEKLIDLNKNEGKERNENEGNEENEEKKLNLIYNKDNITQEIKFNNFFEKKILNETNANIKMKLYKNKNSFDLSNNSTNRNFIEKNNFFNSNLNLNINLKIDLNKAKEFNEKIEINEFEVNNNNNNNIRENENNLNIKSTKTKINNEKKLKSSKVKDTDIMLRETLTTKVVILVLLMLVTLPMLSFETVISFIVAKDTNVDNYCMKVINKLLNDSLTNSFALYNLEKHINACLNVNLENENLAINNTEPYFLYINFSLFDPYTKVLEKYNNTEYNEMIPKAIVDRFSNRTKIDYFRKDYDYFVGYYFFKENEINSTENTINTNNTKSGDNQIDSNMIIYITNNIIILVLESTLNIFKSLFIGIVLISGAFFISTDATEKLISPLEKLYLKLNFLLSKMQSDEVYMKENFLENEEKKLIQLSEEDRIKKRKIYNPSNVNKSEMQIIDESMESLAKLVSMTLGQNSKFIF